MTENTNGFLYLNSPRLKEMVLGQPKLDSLLTGAANLIYESAEDTGVDIKRIISRPFAGEPEDDEMRPEVILDVITHLGEKELDPMKQVLQDKIVLFEQEMDNEEFSLWFEKVSLMIR